MSFDEVTFIIMELEDLGLNCKLNIFNVLHTTNNSGIDILGATIF